MIDIIPGCYRHYKGNYYQVMGLATHSETEELLVVYRTLYGKRDLWVRPASMFSEIIDIDGVEQARFQYVAANAPSNA